MCACRLKLRVVQKFRSSQPEHLFVLEVWRGSILVDRSYTCHRLNGTQWYLSREKAALYSHCALSFQNAYFYVLEDSVFTSVFAHRACTFCMIDSLLFVDT